MLSLTIAPWRIRIRRYPSVWKGHYSILRKSMNRWDSLRFSFQLSRFMLKRRLMGVNAQRSRRWIRDIPLDTQEPC